MELGGKGQEGKGQWWRSTLTVPESQHSLPPPPVYPGGTVLGDAMQKCLDVIREYGDTGSQAFMLLWARQVLPCPDYLIVGLHFCAL